MAESLLGDIASQYSELLPHLTVPLAKDFSVAFPSSQIPLTVPTQVGRLNEESTRLVCLTVNGFSLRCAFPLGRRPCFSCREYSASEVYTGDSASLSDRRTSRCLCKREQSRNQAERWANSIFAGEDAIYDQAIESGGFGCAHLGVEKPSLPSFGCP